MVIDIGCLLIHAYYLSQLLNFRKIKENNILRAVLVDKLYEEPVNSCEYKILNFILIFTA